MVKNESGNLKEMCPELEHKPLREMMNIWMEIEFYFPVTPRNKGFLEIEESKRLLPSLQFKQFKCFLSPIYIFHNRNCIGYSAIFAPKTGNKEMEEHLINEASMEIKLPPDFLFRYDLSFNSFVREVSTIEANEQTEQSLEKAMSYGYIEMESNKNQEDYYTQVKSGFYINQRKRIEAILKTKSHSGWIQELIEVINHFQRDKPDYGFGVATYRLINGETIAINEKAQIGFADPDMELDTTAHSSSSSSKNLIVFLRSLKSKKVIIRILKSIKIKWIILLIIGAFLILTSVVGLASYITVVFSRNYHQIQQNIILSMTLLEKNMVQLFLFHNFRELLLLSSKKFTNIQDYYNQTIEDYSKDIIANMYSNGYELSLYVNTLVKLVGSLENGNVLLGEIAAAKLPSQIPFETNSSKSVQRSIPFVSLHYQIASAHIYLANKLY